MNTHTCGNSRRGTARALPTHFTLVFVGFLLSFLVFSGGLQAQVDIRISPQPFSASTPEAPPLVSLSPNPASSGITIQAMKDVHIQDLKIYDYSSNLVFSGTYSTGVVWTTTLYPGIHYFVVGTDDGTESVTVEIVDE